MNSFCNTVFVIVMQIKLVVVVVEEERPCLSKYWKIYFPDREISLALFLDYLL